MDERRRFKIFEVAFTGRKRSKKCKKSKRKSKKKSKNKRKKSKKRSKKYVVQVRESANEAFVCVPLVPFFNYLIHLPAAENVANFYELEKEL